MPTIHVADEANLFIDYQLPRRPATAVCTERPRHYVPPLLLRVLLPVMRYSTSSAYVLRAGGRRFGPMVRPRLSGALAHDA